MGIDGTRSIARLPAVRKLIELALEEDLGRGDITTDAVVGDAGQVRGAIVAREPLVISGCDVARAVFTRVDSRIDIKIVSVDGSAVQRGARVIELAGPAGSVLEAERTALNFLQRLSGIATLARRYAEAVAGTDARVVDTRKTTPGYRVIEKAAVLHGGCHNHRFDLGSGVLIKDNHIVACGSVTKAVQRARARAPHPFRIEIEVDTVEQLDEAIAAGTDIVLLDNMSPAQVATAAAKARAAGVLVEVSGGITLDTVRSYADAGADVISSGALTHSAPSVDLALDLDMES